MAPTYRGRFAPSPTGALHLGAARTALVAWLRARQQGGAFILRVEDLDRPRVLPGAEAALMRALAWLGLDWDEGPGPEGGPYRQSRRLDFYETEFERFKAQGRLYPCTCSRSEMAESASAPHGEAGPLYPGFCREGVRRPGRPVAWRFRMDAPEAVEDFLAGSQAGLRDDFVVRRADGVFSYQWACALDDAAMGVTEVVRGADLLASAARQAALHRALGARPPAWMHVPLLVGPDGTRLSKRGASVGICAYRDAGWTPERLVGLLVRSLGWTMMVGEVSAADLVGRVDFKALGTKNSVFSGPWP